MPELPEVETIRRQLEPMLTGAHLLDAWAFPSSKFTPAHDAVGARILGVGRRGKYLILPMERPDQPLDLVVHLGMTGRLSVSDATRPSPAPAGSSGWASTAHAGPSSDDAPTTSHLRARWRLGDRRWLLFDDVRRFGRIAVVPSGDFAGLPTLAALGPEPFDDSFTPEHLRNEVNRSDRAVKTQLLSQRVVAGVGNIYADEALWRSGVHPSARRITRAASTLLRDALRDVLDEGIRHGGTTLQNYRDARGDRGEHQRSLDCYGRAGEPCVRCGSLLVRTIVDARSTVHCANCQRRSRWVAPPPQDPSIRPSLRDVGESDASAGAVVLDCD